MVTTTADRENKRREALLVFFAFLALTQKCDRRKASFYIERRLELVCIDGPRRKDFYARQTTLVD